MKYAEDLLLACLFPKTRHDASEKLNNEAYSIIVALKDALKKERAKT